MAVRGALMQLLRQLLAQVRVRDLPAGSAKIWAQPEQPTSNSTGASGRFTNLATWFPAPGTSLNLTIHTTGAREPAFQGLKNTAANSWLGSSARKKRRFSQKQKFLVFVLPFISLQLPKSIDTS